MALTDFWRTEVFHPLSVHFPIALLLFGTLFKLLGYWRRLLLLNTPGTIMLVLGVLTGWLAIYTGNLADGIVSRNICDPTVLKDHENSAYTMIWLFSGAVALELINYFKILPVKKVIVNGIVGVLLLAGSGFLVYTGHLGAELVYEQAAGVNVPSSDCSGF